MHACVRGCVLQAQVATARERVMGMLEDAIKDYFRKKFRATYPVMDH